MQKYAGVTILLFTCTLLACGDDDMTQAEVGADEVGDGDGDPIGDGDGAPVGDGDGAPVGDGDGDGDPTAQCWNAPQRCLDFITCAGAIAPEQLPMLRAQFGEGGSCWCNTTEAEAQACYQTCVRELATAIQNNPTEPLCHGRYCPLEQLDPEQPYGPVVDGACPEYAGRPQRPLISPFGVPGSVCAPPCSGLANYCVGHTQTIAQGTCMLSVGDTNYCVTRCWVDPYHLGRTGTQCQCGARCQPFGPPDGEGKLRGICTYE